MAHRIHPSVICFAAAWTFALAFMVGLFDFGFQVGDEGFALVNGWRVLRGEIPGRDFADIVPAAHLPTAAFFAIFGTTVFAARLLAMTYGVALLLLVDRLLVHFNVGRWPRIAAVAFLVPHGVWYWPMPSHHWVVILLQLAGILLLLRGLTSHRPLRCGLAAGVLSALACFSQQDQGGYFVLATGLLFSPWLRPKQRRNRLLLGWATGGALCAAAFALWLLPHVSLGELWYQWVRFPLEQYKGLAGNRSGLLRGWEVVLRAWQDQRLWLDYRLNAFFAAVVLTVLPLAFVVALGWGLWRKRLDRPAAALLAAGGLSCWAAAYHRWSLTYSVWAAPISLVAVLIVLDRWLRGRTDAGKKESQTRKVSQRTVGQRTVGQLGAGILVGALIVSSLSFSIRRLQLGADDRTFEVRGRAGSLRSPLQSEAQALQITIDAIEQFVPVGKPLFCAGYFALINFLTLRPNPTAYTLFVYPGLTTDTQARDAINVLRRQEESYVMLPLPMQQNNVLHQYVSRHYRQIWVAPWRTLGLFAR